MDIFIAWSGEPSKSLAQALYNWLPDVIPTATPFLSTEDIRKGQRWLTEISARLEKTSFAILCVSSENLSSPWMHFEAGAASKSTTQGRVCALLLDVTAGDLNLPLSQFQHAPADKDEVLKLVLSVDETLGEQRRGDERVKKAFEKFWPDLEARIEQARKALRSKPKAVAPRRSEEILESILDAQQGILKRLANLELRLPGLFDVGSAAGSGVSFLGRAGGQGGEFVEIKTDRQVDYAKLAEMIRRFNSASVKPSTSPSAGTSQSAAATLKPAALRATPASAKEKK